MQKNVTNTLPNSVSSSQSNNQIFNNKLIQNNTNRQLDISSNNDKSTVYGSRRAGEFTNSLANRLVSYDETTINRDDRSGSAGRAYGSHLNCQRCEKKLNQEQARLNSSSRATPGKPPQIIITPTQNAFGRG